MSVIIVGGGPVGLVAAHALHAAGIPFTLLESRALDDVLADGGASLFVGPHNLRVLHQLGLGDEIERLGVPLRDFYLRQGEGWKHYDHLGVLERNHGLALLALHRADLVRTLYHGLAPAAKERFLTSQRVVDVSVAPDGSGTVTCADGTTHTASLVIGADGVRSRVREAIRRQDESADQPLLEKPFDVFYRTVWASFPRGEGQPVPGGNYENRGEGRTTMYLTGPDKAWIFLIERIQRERSEDTKRYDDKDTASVASTFADSTLAPDLSVRDVLALPGCLTGMTDLSEGIVPVGQAASGPLVLVGDAWHAYTPNAGLGFNAGAQDVIWLANRLASHWKGGDGDKKTLAEAVDGYDQARRPAVAADLARSALTTRIGARDGWLHRFLGDWVLWFPFVQRLLAGWTVSPQVKTGLVLEYVAGEERVVGAVPWDHGIPGR